MALFQNFEILLKRHTKTSNVFFVFLDFILCHFYLFLDSASKKSCRQKIKQWIKSLWLLPMTILFEEKIYFFPFSKEGSWHGVAWRTVSARSLHVPEMPARVPFIECSHRCAMLPSQMEHPLCDFHVFQPLTFIRWRAHSWVTGACPACLQEVSRDWLPIVYFLRVYRWELGLKTKTHQNQKE